MTDPVDVGALAEAVEWWERMGYKGEMVEAVAAAGRAVLEAPTAEWCETHDSKGIMPGFCQWQRVAKAEKNLLSEPCKFGRVRLVAESQPDTPT